MCITKKNVLLRSDYWGLREGSDSSGCPVQNVSSSALPRCLLVHDASENQKEEKALLKAAARWTWERISDEWIHQQTETEGAVWQAGPERPTSENMVSEPQDEEEAADDARTRVLRVLRALWTWSWPAAHKEYVVWCGANVCSPSHGPAVCGVHLYLWMCKMFIFLSHTEIHLYKPQLS